MIQVSDMDYDPTAEALVSVLCNKTQNSNRLFFRVLDAYYACKVASTMRIDVDVHNQQRIPVNLYALNLAVSGSGKGHATNIIEESVINTFKDNFLNHTLIQLAEENLNKIAVKRANRDNADPDEVIVRVMKEYEDLGALQFSFSEGTSPAIKQMRHKLLMANAGSINFEIDEIGSNLLGQVEALNTFLELYDVGKVKPKLTKNTKDSSRNEEINGRTPTNLMLFGTPVKLFNGGKVEDELWSFIESGYGRRFLYGFSGRSNLINGLTAQEIFDIKTDKTSLALLDKMSADLGLLADPALFGRVLKMSHSVSIELIEYEMFCCDRANKLGEHDEMRKAELTHRHFKATKLAGGYAFRNGHTEITSLDLQSAIKLVEESGDAFSTIINRDRNYVKLAKYISSVGREVTHVDLMEDLPFYKGSEPQKRDMMQMAITYGYKNNIIIKRAYYEGIEFISGESLAPTDLSKICISYSDDMTTGYVSEFIEFNRLHELTQLDGYHWLSHHLTDGYRDDKHIITGFNMVVIDVDDGVPMDTAKEMLKNYTFHIYSTKRSTPELNRYRIVLPINYTLHLSAEDHKEFLNNVYEWLPFEVDDKTNQRSKKWLTNNGEFHYNEGQLLDALDFIPKTTKNEARQEKSKDLGSLSNLERWFVRNTAKGNRNNNLLRFALTLVDSGIEFAQVQDAVIALNNKLPDKMDETRLMTTVIVTASKRYAEKQSA